MTRPGLYLHALRVARRRQLVGRVTRVVNRRRFPALSFHRFRPLSETEAVWRSTAFSPADDVAGIDDVSILGRTVSFPPIDWSPQGLDRLRTFHLHYGEEVLGWARRGEVESASAALGAWIRGNPPRPGDPWHPYV